MKGFIRLLINIVAGAMMLVACVGLVGCSKDQTVTVEVQLSIYNYAENTYYDQEDTVLTLTLYKDYAEETVNAITSYIEEGYYNDAIFYGVGEDKIMVGDLKMDGSGVITQNAIKPVLTPEFERGAVKGSDLEVKEGSVALWRTWYEKDGFSTNNSLKTGRATWFMPTAEIASYNDWFCVFATIDLEDETNSTTLGYLKTAIKDNANTYEVYYTGEYDAEKDDENNGLTFHCTEEVPEGEEVFAPKGEQYEGYKQTQIKVAKGAGNACGAKIVSAKII